MDAFATEVESNFPNTLSYSSRFVVKKTYTPTAPIINKKN